MQELAPGEMVGSSAKVGDLTLPGMTRPLRSPSTEFPPDLSVVNKMNEALLQRMTQALDNVDCSEIAKKLFGASDGRGEILEVVPSQRGTLNVYQNGIMEKMQYYHQVYADSRYVYDPRLSSQPIPKGDWLQHMRNINPNGVTITNTAKGLR